MNWRTAALIPFLASPVWGQEPPPRREQTPVVSERRVVAPPTRPSRSVPPAVPMSSAQASARARAVVREGGATSGGGVEAGISAVRVLQKVAEAVLAMPTGSYPLEAMTLLREIIPEIKVIMVDGQIDVPMGDKTQPSDAFSVADENGYVIYLNQRAWELQSDPIAFETLIHHELMVLLDLENTGEYDFSLEFEKSRRQFWRTVTTENNVCGIQLFAKRPSPHHRSPGQLLASGAAQISYVGTAGVYGVFTELPGNELLFWRGTIDHQGFFRMQIERAPKISVNLPDMGRATLIEPMRVYSDPYDAILRTTNVVEGESYWVFVNCNLF